MFEGIWNECSKWGLAKNVNKRKYICIGENISDLKFGNNKWVENCKQYFTIQPMYLEIVNENNGSNNAKLKSELHRGANWSRNWIVFGRVKRSQERDII